MLVGMRRGHPDLILDTCSVRAKRGGELTGPNPTDRAKRGTKYHVAVDGDGVPVACAVTAANVNDTLVFERLFLAAFAVMARIRTVFADKGYDAEHHRDLCRRFGAEPANPQARSAAWIRARQAALAGGAQQCLGAGEQAVLTLRYDWPTAASFGGMLRAPAYILVAGAARAGDTAAFRSVNTSPGGQSRASLGQFPLGHLDAHDALIQNAGIVDCETTCGLNDGHDAREPAPARQIRDRLQSQRPVFVDRSRR